LASVAANDRAADPSNAALVPVTSPVSAMVRPVAHLVAVAALPVQEPDEPVIDPLEVMQPSRGEPGRNGITYRQVTIAEVRFPNPTCTTVPPAVFE